MQTRPPTVTVPAILFFILEAFAVVGALSNLVSVSLIAPVSLKVSNPGMVALSASPEFALYTKIVTPILILLAIGGLVTGFGLLRGREGARKAGIGLAAMKAAIAIVGSWMTLTYLGPVMEKFMAVDADKAPGMAAMNSVIKVTTIASAVGSAIFGIAIAGVFIVLLTRRSAKAFCTGQFIESVPPPLP